MQFCKENGIRLSVPALGRPKRDAKPDKRQDYADICERVEVEREISLARGKCGLDLLTSHQGNSADLINIIRKSLALNVLCSAYISRKAHLVHSSTAVNW